MKSFVRGALAVALLGSVAVPAMAADLPSRKEAPVYIAPAPVYSWTGFYVGAEFGGQWGNNSTSLVNNFTANTLATTGSYNTSGVVGGGLIGYNYQINQFVLGVEGDLTGSSNQGRFTTSARLPQPEHAVWLRRRRPRPSRLGHRPHPDLRHRRLGLRDHRSDLRNPLINNFLQQKISTDRSGYTVGGGVEYAFAPNWSARLEYRWTDYGKYVSNFGNLVSSIQQHPTDNTIQAALIYHFAAPAPVLAKY